MGANCFSVARWQIGVAKNFRLKMHVLNFFIDTRKQRPRGLVYVWSIIFRFWRRTFWRENVSDLECNREIHLPLSLLKISATETPVTFCCTQAAMLLPCYIPRTSPLNLFTESLFFRPQYVFYEEPRKNVAACDVMEVVNGKTPFIFISKTSAR